MISIITFFTLAALADGLACEWHKARETGKLLRVAVLAAMLETLTWAPIWIALTTRNIWIIAAAIAGSMVGSVIGTARNYRKEERSGQKERKEKRKN